jgi:hypothetical protein
MEIREGYTRVTSVLAPFSGFSRVNPIVLSAAIERGNKVHIAVDCIINGVGYDDEGIEGYIESFMKWKGNKVFLSNPKRFYDDVNMLTGECDAIWKDSNGKHILIDFKTSASVGKTWHLQGCAYKYLAETNGYTIDGTLFVRLKKDGKIPADYVYDTPFERFLELKDVYDNYFKTELTQEELDYEYI